MSKKLGKSEFPAGTGPDDFEVFGPPATKDGEFDSVKICDMGCFTQDLVDSNKYYHAAVVKNRKDGKWYTYFEWGRVGASKPQFQFIECSSEREAQEEFASQLHSKNDRRGQWVTIAGLRTLQAKPGKDCYLVRPQATRSTGLPDARKIKLNEGAAKPAVKSNGSNGTSKPKHNIDQHTLKLMRDLNVATVQYTKGSMADASLPTQQAIDDARLILIEAQKRLGKVGDKLDDQVNDTEIKEYTRQLYSRIPKKKDRNVSASAWILSKDNIALWQQDLDAFESALYSSTDEVENEVHPFGGMRLDMAWVDPKSDLGDFFYRWAPKATLNKHSYIGNMTIKNLWKVDRHDDRNKLFQTQKKVVEDLKKSRVSINERPLFQVKKRPDLTLDGQSLYHDSNTAVLFHGTRSVNVTGILRESLRLPKQLVGVVITGAMFGSGVYFADDWKKSAGYTSLSGSYWSSGGGAVKGRGAFMFLTEVVCGNPHLAPRSYGYTSPPSGTHCIFGKGGFSGVQNNEWIVFNPNQFQLKYLIEFTTN